MLHTVFRFQTQPSIQPQPTLVSCSCCSLSLLSLATGLSPINSSSVAPSQARNSRKRSSIVRILWSTALSWDFLSEASCRWGEWVFVWMHRWVCGEGDKVVQIEYQWKDNSCITEQQLKYIRIVKAKNCLQTPYHMHVRTHTHTKHTCTHTHTHTLSHLVTIHQPGSQLADITHSNFKQALIKWQVMTSALQPYQRAPGGQSHQCVM